MKRRQLFVGLSTYSAAYGQNAINEYSHVIRTLSQKIEDVRVGLLDLKSIIHPNQDKRKWRISI